MVRRAKQGDLAAIKAMVSAHNFEIAKYPFDDDVAQYWLVNEHEGEIKACVQVAMCRPLAWVDNLASIEPRYAGELWIILLRRLRRLGAYGLIGYVREDNQTMIDLAARENCYQFDGKYHIYVRQTKHGRRKQQHHNPNHN